VCESSVELGVSRPVHLPHAAFPDLAGDGIGVKSGADDEGHSDRGIDARILCQAMDAVIVSVLKRSPCETPRYTIYSCSVRRVCWQ
jgi:hypothetical protein